MTIDVEAAPAETGAGLRRGLRLVLGLLVVLALMIAFLAGRLTGGESYPTDLSADAGFARDMQAHHLQAVEMSLILRDRSDDDELRTLAYDIARTQQQQAGQMYGWLEIWGLPQASSREPMAWAGGMAAMGHGGEAGEMPGMATAADLRRLATESSPAVDQDYLRLMIAHHQGGVEMAEAALDRASRPEVRHLATTIVRSQTSEIGAMRSMLAARS